MAIKFTQKLILFSNTLNNHSKKYHQLNQNLTSKNRKENLIETFRAIQTVSKEMRDLQASFIEQFEENENKLPKKWKFFGWRFGEYLEVIIEHTYVVDELIGTIEIKGFWKRLFNIRKTIKVMGKLEKITEDCIEKGDAMNELIQTGKYKA